MLKTLLPTGLKCQKVKKVSLKCSFLLFRRKENTLRIVDMQWRTVSKKVCHAPLSALKWQESEESVKKVQHCRTATP